MLPFWFNVFDFIISKAEGFCHVFVQLIIYQDFLGYLVLFKPEQLNYKWKTVFFLQNVAK